MDHRRRIELIKQLAQQCKIKVFVETGTYKGDTIRSLLTLFEQIISIELDPDLYSQACELFKSDLNVKILLGDSGVELNDVLTNVNCPDQTLVFLDAHYSGGITALGIDSSPIKRELVSVFAFKPAVIIIDDIQDCGKFDWPTKNELLDMLGKENYSYYERDNMLISVKQKV